MELKEFVAFLLGRNDIKLFEKACYRLSLESSKAIEMFLDEFFFMVTLLSLTRLIRQIFLQARLTWSLQTSGS